MLNNHLKIRQFQGFIIFFVTSLIIYLLDFLLNFDLSINSRYLLGLIFMTTFSFFLLFANPLLIPIYNKKTDSQLIEKWRLLFLIIVELFFLIFIEHILKNVGLRTIFHEYKNLILFAFTLQPIFVFITFRWNFHYIFKIILQIILPIFLFGYLGILNLLALLFSYNMPNT